MSTPLTSVCMCTYDRPELLPEAVECFLRQTTEDSELVIINDRPEQEIVVDHPRIRVVNLDKRFESTGEKRTYSATVSHGKYLMFWDDDDIYLPTHTESCLNRLQYYKNKNISRAQYYWRDIGAHSYILNIDRYQHTLLIDRDFYFKVGGHEHITRNEDTTFIQKLLKTGKFTHYKLPYELPTFILRRGLPHARIGSIESTQPLNKERMAFLKEAADKRNITGRIVIEPHWKEDYVAKAEEAVLTLKRAVK